MIVLPALEARFYESDFVLLMETSCYSYIEPFDRWLSTCILDIVYIHTAGGQAAPHSAPPQDTCPLCAERTPVGSGLSTPDRSVALSSLSVRSVSSEDVSTPSPDPPPVLLTLLSHTV